MLFRSILATLATATLVAAKGFTIPENVTDGIYQAYWADDGTEVHELATTATPTRSSKLRRRQLPSGKSILGPFCGNKNSTVNHQDTDAANQDLINQCGVAGVMVKPGMSYYSIRGNTIAHFCNYGATPALCNGALIRDFDSLVTDSCGEYVVGSVNSYSDSGPYKNTYWGIGYYSTAIGTLCDDPLTGQAPKTTPT